MRLIAFITEGVQIRRVWEHIGDDSELTHISPARAPPLWVTAIRMSVRVVRPSRTGQPTRMEQGKPTRLRYRSVHQLVPGQKVTHTALARINAFAIRREPLIPYVNGALCCLIR